MANTLKDKLFEEATISVNSKHSDATVAFGAMINGAIQGAVEALGVCGFSPMEKVPVVMDAFPVIVSAVTLALHEARPDLSAPGAAVTIIANSIPRMAQLFDVDPDSFAEKLIDGIQKVRAIQQRGEATSQ